jgi:hypothetical protein
VARFIEILLKGNGDSSFASDPCAFGKTWGSEKGAFSSKVEESGPTPQQEGAADAQTERSLTF